MIGFTYFDEVVDTTPTTREILDALSPAKRAAVLNGFSLGKTPLIVVHESRVPLFAVKHLYGKIDEIQRMSAMLLRGEVIVTPAVMDGDVEVTPAVYNTPPATINELKSEISALFIIDFTEGQSDAVIDKMILYSKSTGDGDATYYSAGILA